MREKIQKLAKGIVEDITPLINVEPKSFDETIPSNERCRLELLLSTESGNYIKGLAYSSDSRVKILNASYGGEYVRLVIELTNPARDTELVIEGSIDLVTNGGEFSVPYYFRLEGTGINNGTYDTIEDFALSSEEDLKGALAYFGSPDFIKANFMQDGFRQAAYRAFSTKSNRIIALREFLYACGVQEDSHEITQEQEITRKTPVVKTSSPYVLYKRHFAAYAKLRLNYEMKHGTASLLITRMEEELEALSAYNRRPEFIALLKAEVQFLKNDIVSACTYIDSVEAVILNDRQELLEEYFLLEYLKVVIYHKYDKAASLIRLCRKFIEEERMTFLLFYIVQLDGSFKEKVKEYKDFLEMCYDFGSRSPYLLLYYCQFLNDHPEYLSIPTKFEALAINFGKRYGLLDDSIARQVLSANCIAYIKTDKRSDKAHSTYRAAIENDLHISGVYEYYLYSLDGSKVIEMPDKVVEHFAQGDRLDTESRIKLYTSVLTYKKPASSLYKAYAYRIEEFAVAQLKAKVITRPMAFIYEKCLRPELFDASLGNILPELVNSYEFTLKDKKLSRIVVVYEELQSESIFPISDLRSLVTIYSDNALVLAEDNSGNRFADFKYTKERIINNQYLIREVQKTYQDNDITFARKVGELLKKRILTPDDILTLEASISNIQLSNEYKSEVIRKLIAYYNQHTAQGYNPGFLLKINKASLGEEERRELLNAYIVSGCCREAFELIREFGADGVSPKNIKALVTRLILDNMPSRDSLLLDLAYGAFDQGNYDAIILDYLCEHYNGPTENMFALLSRAVDTHTETYDLEERLLAQIIFSGSYLHLNQVFAWYAKRKKTNENIVKAYFTVVSFLYFTGEEEYDSKVFDYLENATDKAKDAGGIPVIYQLAISKHYSELKKPDANQLRVAEMFIKNLLANGIIFPYYKRFIKYFELPANIENSQIICFNGNACEHPVLYSKVQPTSTSWIQEGFDSVYLNQYVKAKILFSEETWCFDIREGGRDGKSVLAGKLVADDFDPLHSYNMFTKLNEISSDMNAGNESESVEGLRDFFAHQNVNETLFDIKD